MTTLPARHASFVFTEQIVTLDGYDDAGSSEQGTAALFDKLDASLR